MIGYDQGGESDQRSDRASDAVTVDFIQNPPQQHSTPAAEHGGRVEVGHRRAAFQIHPEDQAERVQHESQPDQIKGRVDQTARHL